MKMSSKNTGFNCIYDFCETGKGWVQSFEDCCPFCVHIIIKNHGTKEDKVLFNQRNTLGDSYIIPLTRKDIALDNKAGRPKCSSRGNFRRKQLQRILKSLRANNICTLRRNKKTLYRGLFGICDMSIRGSMKDYYVYIPNCGKSSPCFSIVTQQGELQGVIQEYKDKVGYTGEVKLVELLK